MELLRLSRPLGAPREQHRIMARGALVFFTQSLLRPAGYYGDSALSITHYGDSALNFRGVAALGDAVRLVRDDDNGRGGIVRHQLSALSP